MTDLNTPSGRARRVQQLREGGHVQRMHTVPIHGEYRVDSHSWQMCMLLYTLHPNPSPDLVKAVLMHDCHERWVGDTPATAKWNFPELYEGLKTAEARVDIVLEVPKLLPEDHRWLKALDMLEFILFCEDQLFLGNRHVEPSLLRASAAMAKMAEEATIPAQVAEFLAAHVWERTDERP